MGWDYMTALQRRFHIKSERTEILGHDVESAYDALHDTLSIEQQMLLLRFLDAEEALRDAEVLDAFVSGFKLADGIREELGAPYSYEAEDEARAREAFERTHTENGQD
jgi:hypothetical protein